MRFRSEVRLIGNHKGHGLGLGFADLLATIRVAVVLAAMQHFVSNLMHERGKLFRWLHPGKQRDFPAIRETLRGSNSLGETKLDTLRFHELEQSFAVSAHVAIDFGQCWEFFAFRLANVENIDGSESVQRPLTLSKVASSLGSSNSVAVSLSKLAFRPSGRE